MKFRRPDQPPNRGLDLAPLVDILLILNIFFLLTARPPSPEGMQVNLTPAKSADRVQPEKTAITINDLDQIILGTQRVDLFTLRAKMEGQDRNRLIFLNADKDASHGRVMQVFDTLRSMSFSQVSFGARREP